ncbi:MAG: ribose 5-phosphate isomerase B [Planctomycetota bacterium]|nr:ribose 5-phosphate isomerase B [Planctomycetota bacterium]
MKIALGADHRGMEVRTYLADMLAQMGCEVVAMGQGSDARSCDYPDVAFAVATAVSTGQVGSGILICGTGIGMSIAANKVAGVRAALVHDEIGADMSRRHNDANVLCLPADLLGLRIIDRIVKTWLKADFEGGRHARRVQKIGAIEQGTDPTRLGDQDVPPSPPAPAAKQLN